MKSVGRQPMMGSVVRAAVVFGARLGRVSTFGVALLLLSFVPRLLVRAEVNDAPWRFGADAMAYPDAPREPARELMLNGISVSFRVQALGASLGEVLDHYEALCAQRNEGFSLPLSTYAARDVDHGFVACLDTSNRPADLASLATRFARFASTHDLSDLGSLRYVRAQRIPGGGDTKTLLFTMWAEGSFDLGQLLRVGGGNGELDPIAVPLAPGSRRLVSAWESDRPGGFFLLRNPERSPRQLSAYYRKELSRAGWRLIERNSGESLDIDGARMISAERAGRLVTFLSWPADDLGAISVVLTSARPDTGSAWK